MSIKVRKAQKEIIPLQNSDDIEKFYLFEKEDFLKSHLGALFLWYDFKEILFCQEIRFLIDLIYSCCKEQGR